MTNHRIYSWVYLSLKQGCKRNYNTPARVRFALKSIQNVMPIFMGVRSGDVGMVFPSNYIAMIKDHKEQLEARLK